MNTTNRALNRALILVVGLVLLVAGGAVAAGALLPDVKDTVSGSASDARGGVSDALDGGQPWILWVSALVCVVLIVLLAWFSFRQGRGRTGTLIEQTGRRDGQATSGHVVVDVAVAEQVLEEALSGTAGIVSTDVTAFEVRGSTVLRVTANARRGASPMDIRTAVDDVVRRWDALLGAEIPVVVQINGGLRTQMVAATRLD